MKPGATVIDVGINRVPPEPARARRGSSATSPSPRRREVAGRDHAGAGRRRPDDDRLPARQHADRRLPAGAGLQARRSTAGPRPRPSPTWETGTLAACSLAGVGGSAPPLVVDSVLEAELSRLAEKVKVRAVPIGQFDEGRPLHHRAASAPGRRILRPTAGGAMPTEREDEPGPFLRGFPARRDDPPRHAAHRHGRATSRSTRRSTAPASPCSPRTLSPGDRLSARAARRPAGLPRRVRQDRARHLAERRRQSRLCRRAVPEAGLSRRHAVRRLRGHRAQGELEPRDRRGLCPLHRLQRSAASRCSTYVRWVWCASATRRRRRRDEHVPDLPKAVAPAALGAPARAIDCRGLRSRRSPAARIASATTPSGERIDHVDGMTVEEAEHQLATRLYQNTARVHFDQHARRHRAASAGA